MKFFKRKNVVLVALSLLLTVPAFSQFGVKAGFAMVQPFQGNNNFYAGFDIGFTYDVNENLQFELLFEPTFNGNSSPYISVTGHIVPITVGGAYRFGSGNFHPYIGLNLGLGIVGASINGHGNNSTAFALQPKIGLAYGV